MSLGILGRILEHAYSKWYSGPENSGVPDLFLYRRKTVGSSRARSSSK